MTGSIADLSDEDFQLEARAWLAENFPVELEGRSSIAAAPVTTSDVGLREWRARIGAKGWGTPTWPARYGGGGLTADQAHILHEEMSRVGAFNPMLFGMGVTMVGPTILDYGTEQQKLEHIPRIARGEVQWCVGYSEPNAGSDLASLQTKAVQSDGGWVINGQKTWTSGAIHADWCGLLARTDVGAKKQDGISFLLVDMHQAGVTTRPIDLISGSSPFCETFLNDAFAGANALLGELNKGWSVGKRLLMHERTSQTGTKQAGVKPVRVKDTAIAQIGCDSDGRLQDADLRQRIIRHELDVLAHDLTVLRVSREADPQGGPSVAASALKNSATRVAQTRAELIVEIHGLDGLGWAGQGFPPEALQHTRSWLAGKAVSIYGGSVEIQNNIIAKRILGLRDATFPA